MRAPTAPPPPEQTAAAGVKLQQQITAAFANKALTEDVRNEQIATWAGDFLRSIGKDSTPAGINAFLRKNATYFGITFPDKKDLP